MFWPVLSAFKFYTNENKKYTLKIWIKDTLSDTVKIPWISVNIAPLETFSGAILTDIQRIFTELYSNLNLEYRNFGIQTSISKKKSLINYVDFFMSAYM